MKMETYLAHWKKQFCKYIFSMYHLQVILEIMKLMFFKKKLNALNLIE